MKLTLPTLVLTTCLNVKKDERILIVTDDAQASIAADFFQAAGVFSKNISVYSLADMTENGQEPSDEISQAMLIGTTYGCTSWFVGIWHKTII